jgi:alkylation response protein AidB-like acyl-CoA dehydrogenase
VAAKTALQVHGAIGYTWEVDLHLWMKRAWSLDLSWGSASFHRARIANAILDTDAPSPSFGFEGGAHSATGKKTSALRDG